MNNKIIFIDIILIIIPILWLIGWFINAFYHTQFSLVELQNFYLSVIIPRIGHYSVQSIFNSAKGEEPK